MRPVLLMLMLVAAVLLAGCERKDGPPKPTVAILVWPALV